MSRRRRPGPDDTAGGRATTPHSTSGVTRRDLIAGAATSVVATAAGACRRDGPPDIEARFVGQDPARAHRLRDEKLPRATEPPRKTRVAIVGGGAAGMAAAWRLARAGMRDFVVLELEDALGGTARGGEHPRSPYPMGAHYLPAPPAGNRGLVTLLRDLGIVRGTYRLEPELDPRLVCPSPVERHRHRGLWSEGLYPAGGESPEDIAQWRAWREHLRSLDGRHGRDGRPLFTLPLDASSHDARHLDRISMAAYLDELRLTSWRLRWTVDYACRDDYGCSLEQTSAFAGLHHFLSRGLEDAHDRFIVAFPNGNASLVTRMAKAAGVPDAGRLHTGTAVHAIDPDSGVLFAHDFATDTALALQAEVILWAAPRFVLPHVLPPGTDPLPRGAMTYAPWLVANVEVREAPRGVGAPRAWDNVEVGVPHLGYVVANHGESLAASKQPGAVLSFYEPMPAADAQGLREARGRLLGGTLAAWTEHVIDALAGMHPTLPPHIARIDIARWGHGMIRPVPGWLFGTARAQAAAPVGRVLPCAADVGGLPLFEQAYATAVCAAEDALARLGHDETSIL